MHTVKPLADVIAEHVEATLELVGGNKARAAEALQISRRGVYNWIERIKARKATKKEK